MAYGTSFSRPEICVVRVSRRAGYILTVATLARLVADSSLRASACSQRPPSPSDVDSGFLAALARLRFRCAKQFSMT